MRKYLFSTLTLLMMLMATSAMAQNRAVIFAEKTVHDFGDFKESDGDVAHTFIIKNTGKAPLVITRVIASCGCTLPKWTKEPIAPGKTGKINIIYKPDNRPGSFAKTISVYSNGKTGSYIFTIRGNVK